MTVITTIRTDPFIFRSRVSEAGYEWAEGFDKRPHLVPRRMPGLGFRLFEPHSGLFREFVALDTARDVIREFANNFGDLFSRYDTSHGANSDGKVSRGASLTTWTREIGDMRVLVELWDRIRHRHVIELRKIVRWTPKSVGYVVKTQRRERRVLLAHAEIPATGFGRFSPKDVVLPARCALQQEINFRLAEQGTVTQLAWTPDIHEQKRTPLHQRLIFSPPNLLAAMWLQFAQAVTEEFQLMQCEGCGKYFQIGPGGRRADATTCSDACRQRKKRSITS